MSVGLLASLCFCALVSMAMSAAPVFRNECLDPALHDCPSTSDCVDLFYGFICQCKDGLVDQSPDKKTNPGRVCVGGDGSAPAPAPAPAAAPASAPAASVPAPVEEKAPKEPVEQTPAVPAATANPAAGAVGAAGAPAATPAAAAGGEATKIPPEVAKIIGRPRAGGRPKSGLGSASSKDSLKETFDAFDASKDGQINFSELRSATKSNRLDLSDGDVRLMLKTADKNDDGLVNFEEFQTLMKGRQA